MKSTIYKKILKPIFFSFDAELVHNLMVKAGEYLGKSNIGKNFIKRLFYYKNKSLNTTLAGINFDNPIGLSAGFDYEGMLVDILPSIGFGFGTVGTVTNLPYRGNPKPRLGRLPKSKSLLVNKGFKSSGIDKLSIRLKNKSFSYPVGISVGRSNSPTLSSIDESIQDIITSFRKLEKAKLKNAYYELNISCPNLIHGSKQINFYKAMNLEMLLSKIDELQLSKPLFVKMPITESNSDFDKMLKVIVKHRVSGVIIGNLQKDRTNTAFNKDEIKNAGVGNFSGAPCYGRSNELIARTYKVYHDKLIIIGCGGVFNARDAYEKIKLGSSLIMMITGMIYEGPQIIGEINKEIAELLKLDGYKTINEAVGLYFRNYMPARLVQ